MDCEEDALSLRQEWQVVKQIERRLQTTVITKKPIAP
jgi:hypothetical protein